MSDQAKANAGGVGFGGLLTLLFIGLKLGNIITWSWLWVLSPIWIPIVIVLGIWAIIAIIAVFAAIIVGISS